MSLNGSWKKTGSENGAGFGAAIKDRFLIHIIFYIFSKDKTIKILNYHL